MTLQKDDRASNTQIVLEGLLGDAVHWSRDDFEPSIAPSDLDYLGEYERHRDKVVVVTSQLLDAVTDETLSKLAHDILDGMPISEERFSADLIEQRRSLAGPKPPKIVYGFGHPKLKADFDHWGKMPSYSVYEAVALSFGAAPEVYTEAKFDSLKSISQKGKQLWSADTAILKRLQVFERQFGHKMFGSHSTSPRELKGWFDQIELNVHPEFYAALERYCLPRGKSAEAQVEDHLPNQERTSLLKLIAGMVVEHYGYNPKANRSSSVSKVVHDLEKAGVPLDDKTVRKYLKEAGSLITDDYWSD